jgi:hypothetical protein
MRRGQRRLVDLGGRSPHAALRLAVTLLLLGPGADRLSGQDNGSRTQSSRFELYGFIMADLGFSAEQNDPNWFDTVRPTQLASFDDEFGSGSRFYAGVRQTRLGVKSWIPTGLGELRTTFEFEMFGTGVDEGQTTIRLRHAYAEIGNFGVGQYWSPFMDIDVFPNSIEYWGPNGMAFFRNVHARWMPVRGDSRVTVALERPGASGDQGIYADRIELDGIRPRFPLPDLSAEGRWAHGWGYVELAGILRQIEWDDILEDDFDLDGSATGWGLNLSSNVRISEDVLRLSLLYGEGIQNYMNDAPADIGVINTPEDAARPIEGVALPVFGLVAFYDHRWGSRFTSALGYSRVDIDNTDGQAANAFRTGQYALLNLLYTPAKDVMAGIEFQWGSRDNFDDGFSSDDFRVQFSFKYNFSVGLRPSTTTNGGGQ